MKKVAIVAAFILANIALFAQSDNGYNNYSLCGVDEFGRVFNTITGNRSNKYVGMFYEPYLGQNTDVMAGIYDISKILIADSGKAYTNVFNEKGTTTSPYGQCHFWGEPIFQYYNSTDDYVLRKHVELFVAAGIDFIVFDVTNGYTYDNVWQKIMSILDSYQQQGWNVPKVAFFTNAYSETTMLHMYNTLYSQNLYPNLWFRPDGVKPLIIGKFDNEPAAGMEDSLRKFFYFRTSQWPDERAHCSTCADTTVFHPDGFPWIDWQKPQRLYGGDLINVSPAQHPMIPFSDSYLLGSLNWGRGFTMSSRLNDSVASTGDTYYRFVPGKNDSSKVDIGANFQEEWKVALNVDPKIVLVTGWNQWVAIKQTIQAGTTWERIAYVDEFSKEYSNDIEPMVGGYKDAFYMQLIQNIRKYKGVSGVAARNVSKSIDIYGDISQWDEITNIYRNIGNTNYGRNNSAFAKIKYFMSAPQNNLQEIRVSDDKNNIYFYIKAENNIPAHLSGLTNWMNLFIGIGSPSLQGWNGYNYAINRTPNIDSTTSIEKLDSTGNGVKVADAGYLVTNNILQIKLPKSALGLSDSCSHFYFKVADGVENEKDIMDYYVTGKSLPLGRLSFSYSGSSFTSVKQTDGQQPKNFSLSQNYPNPFNPVTEIRYSVPQSGAVTLKVYNLLGQEVATLVNREQKAGDYTVNFSASNLASGVYIYKIRSGEFSLAKKMTLLK
jgi:hypothetical protein